MPPLQDLLLIVVPYVFLPRNFGVLSGPLLSTLLAYFLGLRWLALSRLLVVRQRFYPLSLPVRFLSLNTTLPKILIVGLGSSNILFPMFTKVGSSLDVLSPSLLMIFWCMDDKAIWTFGSLPIDHKSLTKFPSSICQHLVLPLASST